MNAADGVQESLGAKSVVASGGQRENEWPFQTTIYSVSVPEED